MLSRLVLGKKKLKILVTSSELYLLLLWTVVGGRVAWLEFWCVWLELVCHESIWQSGIWTSFNGELCLVHAPKTEIFHVDVAIIININITTT